MLLVSKVLWAVHQKKWHLNFLSVKISRMGVYFNLKTWPYDLRFQHQSGVFSEGFSSPQSILLTYASKRWNEQLVIPLQILKAQLLHSMQVTFFSDARSSILRGILICNMILKDVSMNMQLEPLEECTEETETCLATLALHYVWTVWNNKARIPRDRHATKSTDTFVERQHITLPRLKNRFI